MDEVRLHGSSVSILPVVRGLPSAAIVVASAFDTVRPDVVALSLGPEDIEALRSYRGEPTDAENVEEEVYMAGLSVWEEPRKPDPCFTEAIRLADERHVRIESLDMDEPTFTDAYTAFVSTVELLLQSRNEKRLVRTKFPAHTPEEFVLAWDAEVNRTTGFARLQREREAYMAKRLRRVASGAGRVLAVIEVERANGVLASLRG